MTKGEELVKTWESRQADGRYPSYFESMADLASLIDSCIVISSKQLDHKAESTYANTVMDYEYRSDSERFRAAGWTSDTSDYVDEFGRW